MNGVNVFEMASYFNYLTGYYAFLVVFGIILIVCAVLGGIILSATVFSKKNEGKYTGFLGWLYRVMNFRTLIVQPVLKLLYCISACVVVATSLITILSGGWGILTGLLSFVVGEILVRLVYELIMLTVLMVTNIMEINQKLGGNGGKVSFESETPDLSNLTSRMQAARQAYQAARQNQDTDSNDNDNNLQ